MFLSRFFQKSYPTLDWIQVEVSSYCNANCIYCPHTAYRNHWQNRYLPLEVFENLIPAFAKAKLVYLQGWGEPFTHPHFFDMLRFAKESGCMVGTTSNATLLSRKSIESLINEGIDVIGFSLAGVDEKNDSIREGTRIRKVLDCIDEIHRVKHKYGIDSPKIHVAYMLMRSRLEDLDRLPRFLGNAGVSETVVSSLSLVVSPEMEAEAALANSETEYLELRSRLAEVKETSAKEGAAVYFHIVPPLVKKFACGENIGSAIVIGSDGSVCPCVMKQIPVNGKNFHYFRGQKCRLENLAFGNLSEDSLNDICHLKAYREIVRDFLRDIPPKACQSCLKQSIDTLSAKTIPM
jgi:MoaA/NifB/PqqE/SkfB family radical SAM enzyme